MRYSKIPGILFLCAVFIQCTSHPSTHPSVATYALFLPKNFDQQHNFPVVLFFDPHGKGSFPLSKYSGLANEFNVILIGSNASKNGLTESETDAIAGSLI